MDRLIVKTRDPSIATRTFMWLLAFNALQLRNSAPCIPQIQHRNFWLGLNSTWTDYRLPFITLDLDLVDGKRLLWHFLGRKNLFWCLHVRNSIWQLLKTRRGQVVDLEAHLIWLFLVHVLFLVEGSRSWWRLAHGENGGCWDSVSWEALPSRSAATTKWDCSSFPR